MWEVSLMNFAIVLSSIIIVSIILAVGGLLGDSAY